MACTGRNVGDLGGGNGWRVTFVGHVGAGW